MSLTIRELYQITKGKYQLKSLTGETGFDYTCSWVHMTEDTNVAGFFWGNELVVSSGYGWKSTENLIAKLDILIEARCTGIVFNLGPYLSQVPENVVKYCRKKEFPVFTMPWEMSMSEFVRECCTRITRSMIDDEDLAKAIMHSVYFPQETASERTLLAEHFSEERGFYMAAFRLSLTGGDKKILEQRYTLSIHTAMREFDGNYLVFRHEQDFIVLINESKMTVVQETIGRIADRIQSRFSESQLSIGIGDFAENFDKLSQAFYSAIAARRQSELSAKTIIVFQEMGFERLLYMVSDQSYLEIYYQQTLEPLLTYECKTNKQGVYTETLFYYLLTGGSLQTMSKLMYTHENTIYYRMNKIRDILGCSLKTTVQRQEYLMAYYCGVITGKCKQINLLEEK